MTKLEYLKQIHKEWANEAGYLIFIHQRTNEIKITTSTGTFSDIYLNSLREKDIRFTIDMNIKALRIHEMEYNMKAKE